MSKKTVIAIDPDVDKSGVAIFQNGILSIEKDGISIKKKKNNIDIKNSLIITNIHQQY